MIEYTDNMLHTRILNSKDIEIREFSIKKL